MLYSRNKQMRLISAELRKQKEIERTLSYRILIWRKFLQNKSAIVGALVLIFLYLIMLPAEFTAPYRSNTHHAKFIAAPPQRIHLFDGEGRFTLRPFVYGLRKERDPITFGRIYTIDPKVRFPIHLFIRGEEYKFLFVKTDIHLFGVHDGYMFLLGTDLQGRDMLSRIIYGGRISLTVGLVGVLISIVVGTSAGLISGYFGGIFDEVVQRAIEVLMSFPSIPLWLVLSAALPSHWSPLKVYFGITVILSIIVWGGLARVVRGMTLSLKNEESILAAKMNGATTWWIISRHLLPRNMSYIIVRATLAIPGMILGETALGFLGLGVRPPMVSWGVLLQGAQDVTVLAHQPWLIIPVIMVIVSVLAFNFMGDGMRDAANPFSYR